PPVAPEDLERLLGGYRRSAGLEELHDLLDERTVVGGARAARVILIDLAALEYQRAVVAVRARGDDGADAAVLPVADNGFRVFAGQAAHGFAAGTHQRVERLDRVDRIPREIEIVMLLERTWTPRGDGAGVRLPAHGADAAE